MFSVIPYRALPWIIGVTDEFVDTSRQEPQVVGDSVASAGRGME